MEDIEFQTVNLERTEIDWIVCKINSKKFEIACGALNLSEALNIFRSWVLSSSETFDNE